MKSDLIKYNALVKSIKPLDQRKDAKGKDTFVLSDWWRCNSGELPHFAFVLRAVLTNAPSSCPPERLFSMFNASFDLILIAFITGNSSLEPLIEGLCTQIHVNLR